MQKHHLVVVVEDDRTQRTQITQMLELSGFEVAARDNVVDALLTLKAIRPDVILSGIVMPKMDGFKFCSAVKGLEGRQDVPFVLLSSRSDASDLLKGLECGADGVVAKPIENNYLANFLSTLIASQKSQTRTDSEGRMIFQYQGVDFVLDQDYHRLLRLLVTSFESNTELNKNFSDANTQWKNQAAPQRTEAVDRLAGTLAHDFNNMLMVIKGFTDFLLMDTPEDDKRHTYLSEIKKASDRAAELTNQLLVFSGKQELQEEVFDVNRLLMDIKSMAFSILGGQIKCEYRLNDQALMIRTDKQQFEQVIINLVTNARDALVEGGACTISSALCDIAESDPEAREGIPPGRYARLEVSDDGCGMSRDTLERIFDPFFTTKEQGKGTGLGLSTVFGVVRKSGGYILCSSVLNKGTSFTIYIPLASDKDTGA